MVAHTANPPPDPLMPRHVAIIMDGNGRWARQQILPRVSGHRAGIRPVRDTVEHCARSGVGVLTLFAFSSENWRRPQEEVSGLMSLFLDALRREIDELDENDIRVRFIGEKSRLNSALIEATRAAEAQTAGNTGMQLIIAVAYGGRWDLLQAARSLAADAVARKLDPADIDAEALAARLMTADLPEVDLLIRTGGERRISNFLLWDIAYSELYFSERLWPEFDIAELEAAFDYFRLRQRRFGRTGEQIEAGNC
jgi:undecaprenyl diphosphate synthase